MKDLMPKPKPKKVQFDYKKYYTRPPTPPQQFTREKCRIAPKFVMDNYDYFFSLAMPKGYIHNPDDYITKLKLDLRKFNAGF